MFGCENTHLTLGQCGCALTKGKQMRRKTLDALLSATGIVLAGVMVIAGGLLLWASIFIGNQVTNELSNQQIFFPPAGSEAISAPVFADMRQYAGQQLTTGAQAEVYANDFIAVHLAEVAGGQTYAQVSSAAMADPSNAGLQAQKTTLFQGETLRGLLLNAYAFSTMGTIAGIAAIVSFAGAALLLVFSFLGLWHARKVGPDVEVLATSPTALVGS